MFKTSFFLFVVLFLSIIPSFSLGNLFLNLENAKHDYEECLQGFPPNVRWSLEAAHTRGARNWSGSVQKKVRACLVKKRTFEDYKDVVDLQKDLVNLHPEDSASDVKSEAEKISYTLVNETRRLNEIYNMGKSALWHNFLIKLKLRDGGYCYQWADGLFNALPQEKLKYFERHWGVHDLGRVTENNAVIITRRGEGVFRGIVFDPWRGKGAPFWRRVSEDNEDWTERFNEEEILTGNY